MFIMATLIIFSSSEWTWSFYTQLRGERNYTDKAISGAFERETLCNAKRHYPPAILCLYDKYIKVINVLFNHSPPSRR